MKTEKEVLDYLQRCQSQPNTFPRFKNYFPFEVLLVNNLITPHITTIRIFCSDFKEVRYFIDEAGMFYLEDDFDNSLNPKEILSEIQAPCGWEPLSLKRTIP